MKADLHDHDLRDLAGEGQAIQTQNVVLEGRIVARAAIQYSENCFSEKVIERVLERASVALGRYLAKRLNHEQKNGGN